VGLVFERKERPRSHAVAFIGDTIDLDRWHPSSNEGAVQALTTEIDAALRSLTLNFGSEAEAEDTRQRARQIAAILRVTPPSVADPGSLELHAVVARAIATFRATSPSVDPSLHARAGAVEARLDSLQATLDRHHVSLDDVAISSAVAPGAWFVVRELAVAIVAGPLAIWGWLNHYIPFHAALSVGRRRRDSAADPAMRTIVAGAAFVLMMYMLQSAIVAFIFGPWWAITYVISLPLAADLNLRLRERLSRASRRARTYLRFRSDPDLQLQLLTEARSLRTELLSLGK
jgi:hypothetical protein